MSKKLYKNSNDVMVGGVCSGLAEYLNMDVSVVRIIMVCIVFFTGVGIVPYLVLWIVLPDKKDVVQYEEPTFEEEKQNQEDDLYTYNEDDYKY